MARVYDNWERLVTATLRREDLRITGQRSPSELSLASSSSSPFRPSSFSYQVSSFHVTSFVVGKSFTYHQILQATNRLNDSNLMKHGRSGDLFYGVLEGGTQVVVKKIDLTSIKKESLFISELEILRKVSHYRLVRLLGHCFVKRNQKFLVYKYMPNMDLSSFLSWVIVSNDVRGSLWWKWLNIAIGAAEVLSHLHHIYVPPLVHRDIQASSILLDDNFEVRLGSLYEVCAEEKDIGQNRMTRVLQLPKESVKSTSGPSNATSAYDVYCFGKVLLELVTGKLGFSADNDSSMTDWMATTLAFIVPDNEELVANIVGPYLMTYDYHLKKIWAVALVAKACLSPKPSKRPQMAHILEVLNHINSAGSFGSVGQFRVVAKILEESGMTSGNTISSHSSTASKNHGFWEVGGTKEDYPNREILAWPKLMIFSFSELMVATRNFRSYTVVGEGEFGRVYPAWLEELSPTKSGKDSLIGVRKLYSENMQLLKEWQTRVCLLGRLCHPNLVKFLGYCLEDKVLFIVHEFMQNGSLENHLCKRVSTVKPLSWDLRLKILIGAARGLAFLHASKRRCFHEYFEPSDILLDGSYNVKLWGFGMAKIVRPNDFDQVEPWPNKRRHAYAAPEYVLTEDTPTGDSYLNMKSDVYGFGVVLVEMLTGLSAKGRYHLGKFGKCHLVDFFKSHLSSRRQFVKIMDSRLEGKYNLKAAVQIAQLARTCFDPKHTARPSMKEVVETLECIAKDYPNGETLGGPEFTIFSYSELTVLAKNFRSYTMVGEGEFGRVYYAWLPERSQSKNGSKSLIAIRKLSSQNMQRLEEWQSHVCSLGRLSHANLVNFLGYCLEEKELFLVHEFIQNGSFENHLFIRGSAVQPLSWDLRIKVLIGAARGLAFLHTSRRRGFYEHFEPSDILLDGSYNGKILGFGIGKIDHPNVFRDETRYPSYGDPRSVCGALENSLQEYMPTGYSYMKCDVYGFGVVLVQTLTGLSPKSTRSCYRQSTFNESDLVQFFRLHLSTRSQFDKMMDYRLKSKYPLDAAVQITQLALACLHPEPTDRPSMTVVVQALEHIESGKGKPKEPWKNQTAFQHFQNSWWSSLSTSTKEWWESIL